MSNLYNLTKGRISCILHQPMECLSKIMVRLCVRCTMDNYTEVNIELY